MNNDHVFVNNVCTGCGVERIANTKKVFFMRGTRLVTEPKCDNRLKPEPALAA